MADQNDNGHTKGYSAAFAVALVVVLAIWSWQWHQNDQKFGAPRSGHWPVVRAQHLEREPECAACGSAEAGLEVHHLRPFHLHPELELDDGTNGFDGNLITFCKRCHLLIGHGATYQGFNEDARKDATLIRSRVERSKRRAKEDAK